MNTIIQKDYTTDMVTRLSSNGKFITCAPEGCDPNEEASSKYYQGEVIYSEGDVALFKDDNDDLVLFNFDTTEATTLMLEEDTIDDLCQFVRLCWNAMENIDSNTIFDAVLTSFGI